MNIQHEQMRRRTCDRETVAQAATSAVEQARSSRFKKEIAPASQPHLGHGTQSLLHWRRGAGIILTIGFGLFLVRLVAGMFMGEPVDPLQLSLYLLAAVLFGAQRITPPRRHTFDGKQLGQYRLI